MGIYFPSWVGDTVGGGPKSTSLLISFPPFTHNLSMSHIDLPYLALAARFRLLLRETGFLGMEPISIPLTSLSKLKEAIDLAERLRILQYKYSLLSSFFSASFRDLYHKLPPAVLDLSPEKLHFITERGPPIPCSLSIWYLCPQFFWLWLPGPQAFSSLP